MPIRRAVLLVFLAGLTACSRTPEQPIAAITPTSPSEMAAERGMVKTLPPGSLLTAPVPASGKFDAIFPPRSQVFDFHTRLTGVYRDVLQRQGAPLFVDTEGQVVWIEEFARYVGNGCDVADGDAASVRADRRPARRPAVQPATVHGDCRVPTS